ncbi:hypothetical protein TWF718_008457 [Orbilia javanica]|uniref:RNase III domain-containing protein n=1 Tax=Orbilia javanica TaxID=47235 RepID=A0AAN8MYC7_9PEZI
MQRLLLTTARQAMQTSKSSKCNPLPDTAGGRSKPLNSRFSTSSQIQANKPGMLVYEYPLGVDVPIPPPINSQKLRQVLQQNSQHQNVQTEFGILSFKKLEQIGDMKYNDAVINYLIKKLPNAAWKELMYLRSVLFSNAQLNAFAKGMHTVNRVQALRATHFKRVADIQEAEFGAMSLEKSAKITTNFIEKLIDPAIPFHREVFRTNAYLLP